MFLPVELESGIKALQFDVCCEAIHQNFDCCYVLKKGYANLQFSTNANKKYSTENLVKSSLRATERYAYCLGYLHFTSRYGFPKLNAMYHSYTKKRNQNVVRLLIDCGCDRCAILRLDSLPHNILILPNVRILVTEHLNGDFPHSFSPYCGYVCVSVLLLSVCVYVCVCMHVVCVSACMHMCLCIV